MSYNMHNNTDLFNNNGRPFTMESLENMPKLNRRDPCDLYNADENLIFELGRISINGKRCAYRNISGCNPSTNHRCVICSSEHRGRNCILRDITDGIRVELYSNSNGSHKNGGRFLPVHRSNNVSEGGANLDKIIENFDRAAQHDEAIHILLNPILIDALDNPGAQASHKTKLSQHIERLVNQGKKVVLLSFDYGHSKITSRTPDFLLAKMKAQNKNRIEINDCIRDTTKEISLISYGPDQKKIVAHHFMRVSDSQHDKYNGAHLSASGYVEIANYVEYILRSTKFV